ncbi:cytochrome C [Calothrix rhizosoleniae]|uniref:cytochrome C n=1 Tax=Calothrix rhizosoleniae TaxID=888997 RepID=UPI000B49EFB7|nr:cytochrome C [Calothrix rhizosoleniae]
MANLIKRRVRHQRVSPRHRRQRQGKSVSLLVLVLVWSLAMGWLLSLASNVQGATPTPTTANEIGTVDVVPAKHKLGQELYLENCSKCHIALPPEVLPSQTWKNLLQDSQHYGATLKPLVDPPRILVWRYLSTFSRPLFKEEPIPYRVRKSRFFQALHPKVEFSTPAQINSCVSCHPSAKDFNFRRLSAEMKE